MSLVEDDIDIEKKETIKRQCTKSFKIVLKDYLKFENKDILNLSSILMLLRIFILIL